MAYASKIGFVGTEDGGVRIEHVTVIGSSSMGGPYAFRLTAHDDEQSIGRAEFFYTTRPLDERYARFKQRLARALNSTEGGAA